MNPKELKTKITEKMDKKIWNGKTLLGNFRVSDENSRQSYLYNSDNYVQFYHYLGTLIFPKRLLKIGFDLGLLSGCFLRTCNTVEHFLAFKEIDGSKFYSNRLGKANVKDYYNKEFIVGVVNAGKIIDYDILTNYDLCIINEETSYDKTREYLDLTWEKSNSDGLIVIENVVKIDSVKSAYHDFCIANNQEEVIVKTRNGTGIIRKG